MPRVEELVADADKRSISMSAGVGFAEVSMGSVWFESHEVNRCKTR